MPSLALTTNFKKSIQGQQLAADIGWGASGAIPYALVPSLLAKLTNSRFDGWKGFITAVLSTWGLGAAFDIPQWRSGAWTLGTMHLMYAYDVLGKVNLEMWRFDDGSIGASGGSRPSARPFAAAPQDFPQGMSDNGLQPGATLMQMPDGSNMVVYPDSDPAQLKEPETTYSPGMSDYFYAGQDVPALVSLNPFDTAASL